MTGEKELKPLTHEASELFQKQRETDTVIQNKCVDCGAWFETDKKSVPFQESFQCDCGSIMQFDVPAAIQESPIIQPTNETILAIMDEDQRLDTGMKISEAVKTAAEWWEAIGRVQMQKELMRQAKPVGGADNGAGGVFASKDAKDPNFLPSGIVHGMPWEALGKRERIMIIKIWHHFKVRNPDLIGENPNIKHKMQHRGKVQ